MTKILIVEDEKSIAEGLLFNLKRKNYAVEWVETGSLALKKTQNQNYDLMILDVRLPEVDGFEVCRILRQRNNHTPILMLTARDQPDDIVFGLKSGADDYLTKPFDLAELLARVEGLLRRQQWNHKIHEETTPEKLEFGEYWIDFQTWEAKSAVGKIQLNKKEMEVMKIFLSHPEEVISRKELLSKVWHLPKHPNERIVDNVIVQLRKYFEKDSQHPKHILNVRGVGYKFSF